MQFAWSVCNSFICHTSHAPDGQTARSGSCKEPVAIIRMVFACIVCFKHVCNTNHTHAIRVNVNTIRMRQKHQNGQPN